MSTVHLNIIPPEREGVLYDAIGSSASIVESMLKKELVSPPIYLKVERYDIASNTKIGNWCEGDCPIDANEYLWVTIVGKDGGIDIEREPVSESYLEFLGRDMAARKIELSKRKEAIRRAEGGIIYSVRRTAGQPAVQRILHVALSAAIALVSTLR